MVKGEVVHKTHCTKCGKAIYFSLPNYDSNIGLSEVNTHCKECYRKGERRTING